MKNSKNWLSELGASLKSQGSKALSVLALFAALQAMSPEEAGAQTIVNKKQYENILQNAKNTQEPIGEEMAAFLFGGGIEKTIQTEIEKQNSDNAADDQDGEFSLFNDGNVTSADETGDILSKEEILELIKHQLDSLSQQDFARLYLAFHQYQEGGQNLIGHKKGKGDLGSGWNLAAFPVSIHVDYLEDTKLPYGKGDLKKLQVEFDAIYEQYMSEWKSKALSGRSSSDASSYESADLVALENARQKFVDALFKKYIKPMVDKLFTQYYSSAKDAHKTKEKK